MNPALMRSVIESMFQSENYILANKMMDTSQVRHKLYAGNIANIETPGYKRMDIDPGFEENLLRAVYGKEFDRVDKMRIRTWRDFETKSHRADGNNVQLNDELMRINENAMQYEFLTQYTSGNIKALNKAIRGRV